jgi:hypothetical protein
VSRQRPIVYTLPDCPVCLKPEDNGHRVRQEWLEEALALADTVPIILWPDGRVEVGFEGEEG